MATYAFKLKAVSFGTPTGTAVMPTTMTAFSKSVKGSVNLNESEPEIKELETEEDTAPEITIVSKDSQLVASWNTRDVSPAALAQIKGGTATGTTKWAAPAKTSIIELALKMESQSGVVITVPRGRVIAVIDGTLGSDEALLVKIKVTALNPLDGGSPFELDYPAPATGDKTGA